MKRGYAHERQPEETPRENTPGDVDPQPGPEPTQEGTKYAISIVVHNNLELTKRCLESVFVNSRNCFVIVTDNASTDGTKEYLREEAWKIGGKKFHLFEIERNLGFGIPHNLALAWAMTQDPKPKYFVVLNNDVEVCGHWLEDMSAALEKDPRMAICGVRGTCCGIDRNGVGHPSTTPEYVEASCLMIRADLAQKHGLFSDEFEFAYYEDSDLSLRMRQLGYKITHVPLPIRHEGAATSKIVTDVDLKGFYLKNQRVFLNKWKDYLERRGFGTRSILLVRGVSLGDVVLVTPVIRALREKYPNADISVVSQFPEVFERNPNVQHYGRKILRQIDKYDLYFNLDMAYEQDPSVHIVEAYAKVCGVSDLVIEAGEAGKIPDVYPSEEDLAWATEIVGNRKYFVVHPGPTAWIGRNWSKEKFEEVASGLRARGYDIVLVGGKDAYDVGGDLDLRGNTSFHQLAAIMTVAKGFVGIDSAPMHLAVAARIPTFAVFGCIDPRYRIPLGLHTVGITAPRESVGCLGCHHYLPAPRVASDCFRDRTAKSPPCMDRLTSERVLEVIDQSTGMGQNDD